MKIILRRTVHPNKSRSWEHGFMASWISGDRLSSGCFGINRSKSHTWSHSCPTSLWRHEWTNLWPFDLDAMILSM